MWILSTENEPLNSKQYAIHCTSIPLLGSKFMFQCYIIQTVNNFLRSLLKYKNKKKQIKVKQNKINHIFELIFISLSLNPKIHTVHWIQPIIHVY